MEVSALFSCAPEKAGGAHALFRVHMNLMRRICGSECVVNVIMLRWHCESFLS